MNTLLDDSREDRLIEDYLFSGYRTGSKSNYDLDQQFAKPIQDEDIFGFQEQTEVTEAKDNAGKLLEDEDEEPREFDLESRGSFGDSRPGQLCEDNAMSMFEDELLGSPLQSTENNDKPLSEIDDIFLDDYSQSPKDSTSIRSYIKGRANDENAQPTRSTDQCIKSSTKQATELSPAQLRLKKMKQNFLEQARALSIKPNKIGSDFGTDGNLEFVVEEGLLVSDSNSKFLFNKVFNRSKKATDFCETPEGIRESWALQRNSLVKRLCAQKRKVWDTFQRPVDNFDDEEELIELPDDDEKVDELDDVEMDGDKDDGGNSSPAEDEQEADYPESLDDEQDDEEHDYDEDENLFNLEAKSDNGDEACSDNGLDNTNDIEAIRSKDDNGEGTFEDLEREDMASDDSSN